MFSDVGCAIRLLCSLCCLRICLASFGEHQGFRLGFPSFSNFSTVFCRALCISKKFSCVVFLVSSDWVRAVIISGRMLCFSFSYSLRDNVFCLVLVCLGVCVWRMAYVCKWSEMGGDSVPDVMCVSFSVVRVTSIRVLVLCTGSYLVGVVIVVLRLFSSMKK